MCSRRIPAYLWCVVALRRLAREPDPGPLPRGDPRQREVDERPGVRGRLDSGKEPLGVDLAAEGHVALDPGRRAPVESRRSFATVRLATSFRAAPPCF